MYRDNVVYVDNLWVRYDESEWILKNISMSIKRGETVLVVGRNGSGKTTLLRTLSTQIPHLYHGEVKGSINVLGYNPVREPGKIVSRIGYVGHDLESQILTPFVYEEVGLPLVLHSLRKTSIIMEKIYKALELVNGEDLVYRDTFRLSSGDTAKTVIASNIVREPEILFLDEPTAFLDKVSRRVLVSTLMSLRDKGVTLVIATHNPWLYMDFIDKVYLIEDGVVSKVNRVYDRLNRSVYSRNMSKPTYRSRGSVVVKTRDAWFKYPRSKDYVLKSIDVSFKDNSVYVIIGLNGSGKTTLLKMLSGIYKPSRGRVEVYGKPIYIPQDPRIFFTYETLYKEIAVRKDRISREDWLIIEKMGLREYMDYPIARLSYGCLRKSAILVALLHNYNPILIDEPTAGVDRESMVELAGIVKSTRKCVVIATHDDYFIDMVNPSRIYWLEDGCLVKYGV